MLAASQAEPELSIRRDGCLAARLARAPPPPASAAPLVAEDGSSHLISGGTGGLGLLTARWLAAQQGVGTLVLASNPNPNPNPNSNPNPNPNPNLNPNPNPNPNPDSDPNPNQVRSCSRRAAAPLHAAQA